MQNWNYKEAFDSLTASFELWNNSLNYFDNNSFGLQVNDIELSNATHEEAINALKNTGQILQLTILRDVTQYPDDGK